VYPLLGKLMVGLTGFFVLLALIARALGSTQPPNPALRGFTEGCEDKPQPCWYGIVPGVTEIREAIKMLEEFGFKNNSINLNLNGCFVLWSAEDGEYVGTMEVRCENKVRLGDLLIVLGNPTFIHFMGFPQMSFHQSIALDGNLPCSPDVETRLFLRMYPQNYLLQMEAKGFPWHGFISSEKYRLLEPDSKVACIFYRNPGA
jgi:hypothetical protein